MTSQTALHQLARTVPLRLKDISYIRNLNERAAGDLSRFFVSDRV